MLGEDLPAVGVGRFLYGVSEGIGRGREEGVERDGVEEGDLFDHLEDRALDRRSSGVGKWVEIQSWKRCELGNHKNERSDLQMMVTPLANCSTYFRLE